MNLDNKLHQISAFLVKTAIPSTLDLTYAVGCFYTISNQRYFRRGHKGQKKSCLSLISDSFIFLV